MESIFDIKFREDPTQTPEVRRTQDQMTKNVQWVADYERKVLDYIIPLSRDSFTIEQRVREVYKARIDNEMNTTATSERHRKAAWYCIVAGAIFVLLVLLGLIKPSDQYIAQSPATDFVAGYNATFVWMLSMLATALVIGGKAGYLVFEPWITRRLKSFNPEALDTPPVPVTIRQHWRLVFIDQATGKLRRPELRCYYRVLPITNSDIRAAALEHLYALEIRRLMSS